MVHDATGLVTFGRVDGCLKLAPKKTSFERHSTSSSSKTPGFWSVPYSQNHQRPKPTSFSWEKRQASKTFVLLRSSKVWASLTLFVTFKIQTNGRPGALCFCPCASLFKDDKTQLRGETPQKACNAFGENKDHKKNKTAKTKKHPKFNAKNTKTPRKANAKHQKPPKPENHQKPKPPKPKKPKKNPKNKKTQKTTKQIKKNKPKKHQKTKKNTNHEVPFPFQTPTATAGSDLDAPGRNLSEI